MWKLARAYLTIKPQKATLSGTQPSEGALDGVQFVIAAKLYGPETKMGADGAVDYEPTRPMLRKEAAASFALFSDRINDLTDMKY